MTNLKNFSDSVLECFKTPKGSLNIFFSSLVHFIQKEIWNSFKFVLDIFLCNTLKKKKPKVKVKWFLKYFLPGKDYSHLVDKHFTWLSHISYFLFFWIALKWKEIDEIPTKLLLSHFEGSFSSWSTSFDIY